MTPQRSCYPTGLGSDPVVLARTEAGHDFVEAGLLPVDDPALLSQVLQPGLLLPGYWFLLLAC